MDTLPPTVYKKLPRRKIIDLAKELVLTDGPANVLEFGREITDRYGYDAMYGPDNVTEILKEAFHQADRVYSFLGHELQF